MEANWYMITICSLLLLGIAFSIGLYIWSREFYLKHRIAIRKIYYGTVIATSFFLWAFNAFPNVGAELEYLIALVVSIVAIDLFIFQTPDITKFMSNELKQESLVESINKNRGTFIELSEKLIKVNELMPKSEQKWHLEEFEFTPETYEEFVLSYLRNFTSSFHLEVYSYMVESSPNEDLFQRNIASVYEQIRLDHDFTLRGVGMRKQQVIKTLLDGENIEILEKECSSVLFPYFGEYYNLLFVVSSRKGNEVTGADASLMLNMLYTFDMWLLSKEDEFLTGDESEEPEHSIVDGNGQ
ncbi:type II toxin-antitoxin system SpoIISA family toxin [Bacillus sp. FJAT-50079]|uniref:type II toxin-antitoxin system SpoIISA family toxin n=1 Tax=Bacillus sp. FJAT-50079 TaxID=2833577 RepID=UPI001BC95BE2|nr:type II toxin-antitoxin system SpoIISA family toxin [Bacillus sp. FJAT-50079]MBS4207376.1 type II toxin-antitoxin system SpoIISA family toxin [Bacillus sp. FJAT-50079]